MSLVTIVSCSCLAYNPATAWTHIDSVVAGDDTCLGQCLDKATGNSIGPCPNRCGTGNYCCSKRPQTIGSSCQKDASAVSSPDFSCAKPPSK